MYTTLNLGFFLLYIFNTKTNLLGFLLYDYIQQHKCNFRKRLYSLACEDGKYEQNCTQNCSTYCIGELCNNVDGSCYCSPENNWHPECKKRKFHAQYMYM